MANGFQKINLNRSKSPVSTVTVTKRRKIPIVGGFLWILFGLIVSVGILTGILFFPARNLYFSVQKTAVVSADLYKSLKNQDIELAKTKIQEVENSLLELQKDLAKIAWIKYIPFAGVYEKDAEHLVKASIDSVQAGKVTIETLIPYADLLGLKGKSTFVAGTADERIRTAVETLDKIIPNVDKIAEKISLAEKELEQVDFNRYPEKIGSVVLRSRLQGAKDVFMQTATLFVDAQPLLRKMPEILGLRSPKRYLVLFQNDAEARATGGFITAYGLFKIDKGKLQVEKSEDIYKLDEAKKKKFPAPPPILKYHKNVTYLELRDSNLSPDFVLSMKEFEKMLNDSVSDFPSFDGIIAVDTHVLVSIIRVLGDFNVYGRNFSAETDKRCDCPKVIYELEDYSTKPVAYVREERKDIIGVLLYQILQRALGVSPSKYWGNLSQIFLSEAQQKHVLFYFHDEEAQKGLEALNFAGRIVPTAGDYLLINDVNFAGAKSNMFIKQFVRMAVEIGNDGIPVNTVTINYKNPAPASNCNLEAGQLCLNGILRNWLRVYVPLGATLVEFTGSEKETVTYEEQGKTVFEGFLTVKPQGTAEVKISYKLPSTQKVDGQYKLLIQKQPRTNDSEYTILINKRQIEKTLLVKDKEISVKH